MGIKTLRCGLVALLVPILVTIMARCIKKQGVRRAMAAALLFLYAGGIIWLTLVGRASEESQINQTPFWSYALFADPQYRWQIYLNILLFVLFGFLLPLVIRRGFWAVVLIGLLFSIGIEATQYFFRLGFCEFDDVFHNTLGTALGYGYGQLLSFLERSLEDRWGGFSSDAGSR